MQQEIFVYLWVPEIGIYKGKTTTASILWGSFGPYTPFPLHNHLTPSSRDGKYVGIKQSADDKLIEVTHKVFQGHPETINSKNKRLLSKQSPYISLSYSWYKIQRKYYLDERCGGGEKMKLQKKSTNEKDDWLASSAPLLVSQLCAVTIRIRRSNIPADSYSEDIYFTSWLCYWQS